MLNVKRLDLVWDVYKTGSIKQHIREKRGEGIRKLVKNDTPIPKDWQNFLRRDENKKELFDLLSNYVQSIQIDGKQIIVTRDTGAISSTSISNSHMISPCNHEEADTRVLLHAHHAVVQGYSRIMIRTVDTDVIVLAIANFKKIGCQELWIAFGVGKHFHYIPIHFIVSSFNNDVCESLPFFHAVTGCDTTSSFHGKGKKTAYDTWMSFPSVNCVFKHLSEQPNTIDQDHFLLLEKFIVLMYSRTCPVYDVNAARQFMFSNGKRAIESIPPTQDALYQHFKRSAYQAGHVWGQTLQPMQELPNLNDWGWKQEQDILVPLWTTIPEASQVCTELISCGCKKSCSKRCKCSKANLPCTDLCYCKGNCSRLNVQ